jgi:hypothetical protein
MSQDDRVTNLAEAFGVFVFDLNAGQACEFIYPNDRFSPSDLKTISMLSFPDSQSLSHRDSFDCVYAFGYRSSTGSDQRTASSRSSTDDGKSNDMQCYVYFRQTEDPSNARGYYQKSFVLISRSSRTFSNAGDLTTLARRIGNKFFLAEESGCGREVLMDAYSHVEEHGFIRLRSPSSSDLGMLLTSLSTRSLELSGSPLSPSNGAFALESVYLLIEGLWHLWEALLVDLPILVYCPGRADLCSRIVLSLSSLTSPVEYAGDMRPFLSIFDPDYNVFRISTTTRGCIVGVTSPMAFQQLMNNFKILLSFSASMDEVDATKFIEIAKSDRGRMYVAESITSVSSGTRTRVSSLAARISMLSGTPQLGYRLVLPSDVDSVCNRFVSSSDRINRAIITRHFSLLTRDFLMPFVEYVETDSSVLNNDLLGETPTTKFFVPGKFLSSLSVGVGRHLSQVSTEKLRVLYGAFISTGSFRRWLAEQQIVANRESILAHAELITHRLTDDKIIWMSPSDRDRALLRIAQLKSQLDSAVGGSKAHALCLRLSEMEQMFTHQ